MLTKGVTLYRSGKLKERASQARALLGDCNLCPRQCGVDRLAGETGVCGSTDKTFIASFNPHFGEEQPLVGTHGSGTIFLSGCNLRCCFCQNYDISHFPTSGVAVDPASFASIMLDLQNRGCHNINFVTPSHVVPQILEALVAAYEAGLHLPLVYNSSGYDALSTLQLLDGVIDIYMPDFKFWDPSSAQRYTDAEDYPEIARKALKEMHRQVGDLILDSKGLVQRGLMIRHLLMPAALEETKSILSFIARDLSPDTYVNIMDQYRPCGDCGAHSELQSSIDPHHYRQAIEFAEEIGLTRLDQRDLATLLKRLGFTL